MIRVLATVFAALFGLAFGSFLNVCLSRWPEGESIVLPGSHCRACNRELKWWENVPLLSWLALRGRCRTCGVWIGVRYPLVEAAVATCWGLTLFTSFQGVSDSAPSDLIIAMALFGLSQALFLWLMIALAVLDFEHLWLPDGVTIPATLALYALTLLFAAVNSTRVFEFYGALAVRNRFLWQLAWHRAVSVLAAALLILLIRWLYKLIRHREGLGLGDAKLMALLAAWLGLPGALLAFILGSALGALAALLLLALPRARRDAAPWEQQKLPLGTCLCIGGIVSALWGQPILALYYRWAGF